MHNSGDICKEAIISVYYNIEKFGEKGKAGKR
jgi:hypothetical protein